LAHRLNEPEEAGGWDDLPYLKDLDSAARSTMRDYARVLTELAAPRGYIGKSTVAGLDTVHLADSLAALPVLDAVAADPDPLRIADIGSGAGLPGIPLAIARPSTFVRLIESRGRCCRFLEETVAGLKLPNVRVEHARGELAAHDSELRESFHVVTARALTATPAALEISLPLCRLGGLVLLYKTEAQVSEVEAATPVAAQLGGTLEQLHRYELPGLNQPRVLAVFAKASPTPPEYPRRAGVPKRRPLTG